MTREKGINVIIYDEMVCAGYFQGGKVRTWSTIYYKWIGSVLALLQEQVQLAYTVHNAHTFHLSR